MSDSFELWPLAGAGRFSDRRKTNDEIDECKDHHRDIENHIHIVNLFAGKAFANDGTNDYERASNI